jgi:hypothetical protein
MLCACRLEGRCWSATARERPHKGYVPEGRAVGSDLQRYSTAEYLLTGVPHHCARLEETTLRCTIPCLRCNVYYCMPAWVSLAVEFRL